MKNILVAIFCVTAFFLSGCSEESGSSVKVPVAQEEAASEEHAEITFEKGTAIIQTASGEQAIDIEIAENDSQHAYGFMYRKDIPQGTGMLFLFDEPRELFFWMKNTYVPLDILFIDPNNRIITIAEETTPLSVERIPSDGLAKAALELPGGEAERLGIDVGDTVSWTRADENDEAEEQQNSDNPTTSYMTDINANKEDVLAEDDSPMDMESNEQEAQEMFNPYAEEGDTELEKEDKGGFGQDMINTEETNDTGSDL